MPYKDLVKSAASDKRDYAKHREARCATKRANYAVHRDERRALMKVNYLAHREERLAKMREDAAVNSEKAIERVNKWAEGHPEEVKMTKEKSNFKRRSLGFTPLNQPFPGCEGYHIDKEHVVYVPAELHQGIRHNVWTGRNMEKINAAVRRWLGDKDDRTESFRTPNPEQHHGTSALERFVLLAQ